MQDIIKEIKREDHINKEVENQFARHDEPDDHVKDKQSTGWFIVIALILISFLIIFFIVGYQVNQKRAVEEIPVVEYNGFEFVNLDGLWHFKWQRDNNLYNLHFYFNPEEVESVPVETVSPLDDSLDYTSVFITFDPTDNNSKYFPVAVGELVLPLAKVFERYPISACAVNETPACHTKPIINCKNTDGAVIFFKEDQGPKLVFDNNCIIIQGQEKDLIKAADRLLYGWMNIIE